MTAKVQRSVATTAAQFEAVVAGLQEAALDEDRWRAVSVAIEDLGGLFASHLCVLSESRPVPEFRFSKVLWRGEVREDIERAYVEEWADRDERVGRTPSMRLGRPMHNVQLFAEEERRNSPVYCDFLPRIGSNNQVCVRLEGLHGTDIVWTTSRATGSDWSSEHLGLIRRLAPHVTHFVRVRQALAEANARSSSLSRLIDGSGLGVVFLDRGGRVLEVNAVARRLFAARRGLTECGGRLQARWRRDDTNLNRLLSAACRDGVGSSMSVQPWTEDAAAWPLVLHVCPVPSDRTSWDTRGVAAYVLLTELHSGGAIDPETLAVALGLTRTEGEIAALLSEGRTVIEIATSTSRKESTVRWHVRNLHSKLGVHRQADLVRLVLSTAAAGAPRPE